MVALRPDPIADAWRRAWAAPDRRLNYEWAAGTVVLEGDYANTGPFAIRESRYLLPPLACLDNDSTRMVNVLKSPRTGGSLVGDIWLQHVFKNRPGPFMLTMQTDDDAERHYLTKIKKTFEATPANADLFAQLEKKRDLYQFPHMNLFVQGANLNSLQSKGIKFEWNGEVWLWKPGMMNEAFQRTEDFKRVCKILNESQAGNVRSEWETVYNNGRRHDYAVRCESCGRLQPYEFFAARLDAEGREVMADGKPVRAGVVWDRSARAKDGRWDIARAAETTRWRCRHCGHDHLDTQRTYERLAAAADYFCHDPGRRETDMSFRWSAMVGGDWWRLTKKFLECCELRDFSGSTDALANFYRKELATFWDTALSETKVTLLTSDYFMEPWQQKGYKPALPTWAAHLFITADYQQGTGGDTRHLLVTVRLWADTAHNRSRLLWWGRVNTFADLYKLQLAFAAHPRCVCVDGGFEMMEVATQCAKYGWTMLIGDDPESWPHRRKKGPPLRRPFSPRFKVDPLKGKTGQGRTFCWAIYWSNPSIKNQLHNLRHGLTRHKWETPADVPPEYRDGLDSEVKRYVPKKGSAVPVAVWVKVKAYNHPWDDECMQCVCAIHAGALSFDIEEDAQPASPAAKSEPAKSAAPIAPHHRDEQLTLLKT